MARSIRFFMLIMLMLLLVGCGKPYTEKDNGKSIELSEDDNFQIVLEGDNSPDFNWVLESTPDFIMLQKTDVVKDKGRVIDYVFSFKTVSSGKAVIKLIYTNGRTVAKTFNIEVNVGAMGRIIVE